MPTTSRKLVLVYVSIPEHDYFENRLVGRPSHRPRTVRTRRQRLGYSLLEPSFDSTRSDEKNLFERRPRLRLRAMGTWELARRVLPLTPLRGCRQRFVCQLTGTCVQISTIKKL
jgi:hypothetical protein